MRWERFRQSGCGPGYLATEVLLAQVAAIIGGRLQGPGRNSPHGERWWFRLSLMGQRLRFSTTRSQEARAAIGIDC